jgi:hypothetical protein
VGFLEEARRLSGRFVRRHGCPPCCRPQKKSGHGGQRSRGGWRATLPQLLPLVPRVRECHWLCDCASAWQHEYGCHDLTPDSTDDSTHGLSHVSTHGLSHDSTHDSTGHEQIACCHACCSHACLCLAPFLCPWRLPPCVRMQRHLHASSPAPPFAPPLHALAPGLHSDHLPMNAQVC